MPRPSRFLAPVLIAAAALLAACASHDDDLIRAEVQQLTLSQGETSTTLAIHLARYGRRALPSIEALLHTADEPGRKNLILALRRNGDIEAVPLLRHIAAYDAAESVRREAKWTLRSWAAATDDRAASAREALRHLDELTDRQEAG